MVGVFNNKIWIMDRHTLEHWQHFHESGRKKWKKWKKVKAVEKSGILLQIEKVPETSNGHLTCYVFSLEKTVAHISVTDPSGILTIEK